MTTQTKQIINCEYTPTYQLVLQLSGDELMSCHYSHKGKPVEPFKVIGEVRENLRRKARAFTQDFII